MRVKKSSHIIVLLLFLSYLILFGFVDTANSQEKVIKIGAAISHTGFLADTGKKAHDGYEMWKQTINEKGGLDVGGTKYKIEIVYYDDKSDVTTSAKLTEKLITEDKIKFLLGGASSGAMMATSTIAEKYGAITIAPEAAAAQIYERGYKYCFTPMVTSDGYLHQILNLAKEQNPPVKTVAFVALNHLHPLAAIDGARPHAKKLGIQEVYHATYPVGSKDISSLLIEIKNKKPDLLLLTGYLNECIMAVKQMKELKVNVKMFGMTVGPSYPEFITALKGDAENILVPVQWANNMKFKGPVFGTAPEYTKAFEKRFGYTPDYDVADATAAGVIYHLAFQKAKSIDVDKVRDAIASLDVITFLGPIKFDKRGTNIAKPMAVLQIQQGKHETVYPNDIVTKKFVYPMTEWEKRK